MNCLQFREEVLDLVRENKGALPEETSAAVHKNSCRECSSFLENQTILTSDLHDLREQDLLLIAPSHIEEIVRRNFDQQKSYQNKYRNPFRYWQIAAAMAVSILAAFLLWQSNFQNKNQISTRSIGPSTAAPVVPVPTADQTQTVANPVQPENVGIASSSNEVVETELEIATEFIPLVPSNQEYGSLQRVRVLVPRSSLMQFGLPMNPERAAEPILADFLISEDGVPHAIRFIQN